MFVLRSLDFSSSHNLRPISMCCFVAWSDFVEVKTHIKSDKICMFFLSREWIQHVLRMTNSLRNNEQMEIVIRSTILYIWRKCIVHLNPIHLHQFSLANKKHYMSVHSRKAEIPIQTVIPFTLSVLFNLSIWFVFRAEHRINTTYWLIVCGRLRQMDSSYFNLPLAPHTAYWIRIYPQSNEHECED